MCRRDLVFNGFSVNIQHEQAVFELITLRGWSFVFCCHCVPTAAFYFSSSSAWILISATCSKILVLMNKTLCVSPADRTLEKGNLIKKITQKAVWLNSPFQSHFLCRFKALNQQKSRRHLILSARYLWLLLMAPRTNQTQTVIQHKPFIKQQFKWWKKCIH